MGFPTSRARGDRVTYAVENSPSATRPRGARLAGRGEEGGPARGSGIAKCVSVLGLSQFHKHLALRNPSFAQRGCKHSGLWFGVSSRAGRGGSCDLFLLAPSTASEKGPGYLQELLAGSWGLFFPRQEDSGPRVGSPPLPSLD